MSSTHGRHEPRQPSFLGKPAGKLTLALAVRGRRSSISSTRRSSTSRCPRSGATCTSRVQSLQWVLSGYLLTYGGFMLLGGRAADLLGRRRLLVAGTSCSRSPRSPAGSPHELGDADRRPARPGDRRGDDAAGRALDPDHVASRGQRSATRRSAPGARSAGLASAVGVFLGGVLSEGPGWRWVLLRQPPRLRCSILVATFRLISGERRRRRSRRLRRARRACS